MRRLGQRDLAVIIGAELDAEVSSVQLAQRLDLSEATIRRALQRLLQSKVVQPHALINSLAVGYHEHVLFFSLAFEREEMWPKALDFLLNAREVNWYMEFGGRFQFCVGIMTRSVADYYAFFDRLNSLCGAVLRDFEVVTTSSYTYFGRRYLSESGVTRNGVVVMEASQQNPIDTIDTRILQVFSKSPLSSHMEMARTIKIPFTTFQYRLQNLRKRKVLRGVALAFAQPRLGYHTFRLLVQARSIGETVHGTIAQFCRQEHAVTSLRRGIGRWEYEMGVELDDPSKLTRIIQKIAKHVGGSLQGIEVLTLLKVHKSSFVPRL